MVTLHRWGKWENCRKLAENASHQRTLLIQFSPLPYVIRKRFSRRHSSQLFRWKKAGLQIAHSLIHTADLERQVSHLLYQSSCKPPDYELLKGGLRVSCSKMSPKTISQLPSRRKYRRIKLHLVFLGINK